MDSVSQIAGIIVAAGYSSRMGNFKPLLPLGGKTVLETAVDSLRQGGIGNILVVTGHRVQELLPFLEKSSVEFVYNPVYDKGMFSSIVAGLKALAGQYEAFFLLPADNPLIRRNTIKALLKERQKTGAAIIQPVFNGQKGHPPLIGEKCFDSIFCQQPSDGLRGVLRNFAAETAELEVADQGILLDMDTPADYENLKRFYARWEIPVYEECLAILHKYQPNPNVLRHSLAVAALGKRLGDVLNEFGFHLNTDLITAGAMLHDLVKGRRNHAKLGGKLIARAGFAPLSKIIASHTDIEFTAKQDIDEAAVVFLADKLFKGDKPVSIAERFKSSLEKFSADPEISVLVLRRLQAAQAIRDRIIGLIGITRFQETVFQ